MTMFRSKKTKSGKSQAYPVTPTSRKTPKRNYSSGKPSWSSKVDVHSDIKKMHRQDDPRSPSDHGREHDLYKRRLVHESDSQYIKEEKRANKKQKKLIKKDEKEQLKQTEEETKKDCHEDQETEKKHREEIQDLEGNSSRSEV